MKSAPAPLYEDAETYMKMNQTNSAINCHELCI